jgi:YfiH family protein
VYQFDVGRAHVAISTRAGGVSVGSFAELDLADHVGDEPAAVAENRRRLAGALDLPGDRFVWMRQVHGGAVAVVTGASAEPVAGVDGLVTGRPGVALGVLVADCVPVLLLCPDAGLVAAAHAGWRGVAAEVVPATVATLRALGAGDITAVVGPAICPNCYEVSAEVREAVRAVAPAATANTAAGRPALDLRAAVRGQLAGVVEVVDVASCTAEDARYFSHRRDGVTGRFAGVVWLDR